MADLEKLVTQAASGLGQHVMIRFDPLRTSDRWTVAIDGIRLCDTDRPITRLLEYALQQDKEKKQKSKK